MAVLWFLQYCYCDFYKHFIYCVNLCTIFSSFYLHNTFLLAMLVTILITLHSTGYWHPGISPPLHQLGCVVNIHSSSAEFVRQPYCTAHLDSSLYYLKVSIVLFKVKVKIILFISLQKFYCLYLMTSGFLFFFPIVSKVSKENYVYYFFCGVM